MKTLTLKGNNVSIGYLTELVKSKLENAENNASQYISICVEDGEYYANVKIRVSNHSAKKENGNCLSFITGSCNQGYSFLSTEWEVESIDSMLTTTSEYISDILEYELFENTELS